MSQKLLKDFVWKMPKVKKMFRTIMKRNPSVTVLKPKIIVQSPLRTVRGCRERLYAS